MPSLKKTPAQLIAETGADATVARIEERLRAANQGKRPVYSDIIKKEADNLFEYVNYVQEGGGMLGIALIGYTYVLERMGFRFMRLAGTSAGAITTIMLAAVDKKNYPTQRFSYQSEIMLHEMLNYDLWKFVDGHWLAKVLIRIFINYRFGARLLKFLIGCSIVIPLLYALFLLIMQGADTQLNFGGGLGICLDIFSLLTWISLSWLVLLVILFFYLHSRFKHARYGINTGRNFHDWITFILVKNGVGTMDELDAVMRQRYEGIELRPERVAQHLPGDGLEIPAPFLTLVASDITSQTKVEFPLNAKDYWLQPGSVNPADFVRASMSIPVFFEPYRVLVPEQVQTSSTLQKMKATLNDQVTGSPKTALFVDGGILSNFPINVFHNPAVQTARLPTFGVKLEDEDHIQAGKEAPEAGSVFDFIMTVFSTVRFYYDRDFLKRNAVYQQCIGYIDAAGYNWLNFGMDYKAKKELFAKGVQAAEIFFLGGKVWVDGKEKIVEPFSWEQFKYDRQSVT